MNPAPILAAEAGGADVVRASVARRSAADGSTASHAQIPRRNAGSRPPPGRVRPRDRVRGRGRPVRPAPPRGSAPGYSGRPHHRPAHPHRGRRRETATGSGRHPALQFGDRNRRLECVLDPGGEDLRIVVPRALRLLHQLRPAQHLTPGAAARGRHRSQPRAQIVDVGRSPHTSAIAAIIATRLLWWRMCTCGPSAGRDSRTPRTAPHRCRQLPERTTPPMPNANTPTTRRTKAAVSPIPEWIG